MKVVNRSVVELDPLAVDDVFAQKLDTLCGGEDVILRGDKVFSWDRYAHGSGYEEEIKKPSKIQIAALRLREALKEKKP